MKSSSLPIWIKIVLAISVALNGAWLVKTLLPSGAVTSSPYAPAAANEIHLQLTPKQRSTIKSIMNPFRLSQLRSKQEILDKRIEILESLGDDSISPRDLSEKVDQLNALENQLNQRFIERLAQISSVLNADQRMKFLLRLSRGWFFRPGGSGGGRSLHTGGHP